MTKKPYIKVFVGICLALFLISSTIVIPKLIQSGMVANNIMNTSNDIGEFIEILHDYKNDDVTNEYASTLLQRRLDSLTSGNDFLLELFPKSRKISDYHVALNDLISKFDEIRLKVENQEQPDELFLSDIELEIVSKKYQDAVISVTKFWSQKNKLHNIFKSFEF